MRIALNDDGDWTMNRMDEQKGHQQGGEPNEAMANVRAKVLATIDERRLADETTPVLLMVSGGSDSTALAYIVSDLHEQGKIGPLAMLHVNHRLRADASDGDAAFVQHLADALEIPLFMVNVNVAEVARTTGQNVEAAGRAERYASARDALKSLCAHVGADVSRGRIFTAHTADDRVENFYMRSIVGTGPGGFRSMRYARGNICHPLLDCARDDLRDYIRERAQGQRSRGQQPISAHPVVRDAQGDLWREDATNEDTDRFRAFVRHEIVPVAKARNPQLLDVLTRTMNLIADEDDMLEASAKRLFGLHVAWIDENGEPGQPGVDQNLGHGCVIDAKMARCQRPILRRVVLQILRQMVDSEQRIDSSSVRAAVDAFGDTRPISGYTANIQGDLAISANKRGVRIEPMADYRARRKGVK